MSHAGSRVEESSLVSIGVEWADRRQRSPGEEVGCQGVGVDHKTAGDQADHRYHPEIEAYPIRPRLA